MTRGRAREGEAFGQVLRLLTFRQMSHCETGLWALFLHPPNPSLIPDAICISRGSVGEGLDRARTPRPPLASMEAYDQDWP